MPELADLLPMRYEGGSLVWAPSASLSTRFERAISERELARAVNSDSGLSQKLSLVSVIWHSQSLFKT
jgi:hypothetical protein